MKKILVLLIALGLVACTSHEYIYNGVSMSKSDFEAAVVNGKVSNEEMFNWDK